MLAWSNLWGRKAFLPDPAGLRARHAHPRGKRKVSKWLFGPVIAGWGFLNGNSALSVCVQSSFTLLLPPPLCSLLLPSLSPGLLPPAFPWECFSCLLLSLFSLCWFTRPNLPAWKGIWAQAPCCASLGTFPCDEHPAAAGHRGLTPTVGVSKGQVLPWHPSPPQSARVGSTCISFSLTGSWRCSGPFENKQLFKCVQKRWIWYVF